jgi:hypothetical protein
MVDLRQHTYEEIREVVTDVLLNPLPDSITHHSPNQWASLLASVGIVFSQREGRYVPNHSENEQLHPYDRELVRDVFWDLFRQGVIVLGMNDSNPMWPWFRLSHFGQKNSRNPKSLPVSRYYFLPLHGEEGSTRRFRRSGRVP